MHVLSSPTQDMSPTESDLSPLRALHNTSRLELMVVLLVVPGTQYIETKLCPRPSSAMSKTPNRSQRCSSSSTKSLQQIHYFKMKSSTRPIQRRQINTRVWAATDCGTQIQWAHSDTAAVNLECIGPKLQGVPRPSSVGTSSSRACGPASQI